MYYKCEHCNGKGITKEYTKLYESKTLKGWQKTKLCLYCHGKGKLDWIENIIGKNTKNLGNKIQRHWSTEWCNYE